MSSEFKQPTRAELIARHNGKPRVEPKQSPVVRGGVGFADPGGVVSQARAQELGAYTRVRVTGRWPR